LQQFQEEFFHRLEGYFGGGAVATHVPGRIPSTVADVDNDAQQQDLAARMAEVEERERRLRDLAADAERNMLGQREVLRAAQEELGRQQATARRDADDLGQRFAAEDDRQQLRQDQQDALARELQGERDRLHRLQEHADRRLEQMNATEAALRDDMRRAQERAEQHVAGREQESARRIAELNSAYGHLMREKAQAQAERDALMQDFGDLQGALAQAQGVAERERREGEEAASELRRQLQEVQGDIGQQVQAGISAREQAHADELAESSRRLRQTRADDISDLEQRHAKELSAAAQGQQAALAEHQRKAQAAAQNVDAQRQRIAQQAEATRRQVEAQRKSAEDEIAAVRARELAAGQAAEAQRRDLEGQLRQMRDAQKREANNARVAAEKAEVALRAANEKVDALTRQMEKALSGYRAAGDADRAEYEKRVRAKDAEVASAAREREEAASAAAETQRVRDAAAADEAQTLRLQVQEAEKRRQQSEKQTYGYRQRLGRALTREQEKAEVDARVAELDAVEDELDEADEIALQRLQDYLRDAIAAVAPLDVVGATPPPIEEEEAIRSAIQAPRTNLIEALGVHDAARANLRAGRVRAFPDWYVPTGPIRHRPQTRAQKRLAAARRAQIALLQQGQEAMDRRSPREEEEAPQVVLRPVDPALVPPPVAVAERDLRAQARAAAREAEAAPPAEAVEAEAPPPPPPVGTTPPEVEAPPAAAAAELPLRAEEEEPAQPASREYVHDNRLNLKENEQARKVFNIQRDNPPEVAARMIAELMGKRPLEGKPERGAKRRRGQSTPGSSTPGSNMPPGSTPSSTQEGTLGEQEGEGKRSRGRPRKRTAADDSLFDTEIASIMRTTPHFEGVFSVDKFAQHHPAQDAFAAVVNTKPFPEYGHWVALTANIPKKGVAMYYDPLGDKPSVPMRQAIRRVLRFKRVAQHGPFQMKINRVRSQGDTTSTCGWHAMKFLKVVLGGASFKDATGYSALEKRLEQAAASHTGASEAAVQAFKKRYEPFKEAVH
jgi:hypothetical protein